MPLSNDTKASLTMMITDVQSNLEDASTELNMHEKKRKYVALKGKLEALGASVTAASVEVQEARARENEAKRVKAEAQLVGQLGEFRGAIEEARLEQFTYD